MTETPPSPPGYPVVGNTLAFAREPFGFADRAVDEHGDVVDLDVLGAEGPYLLAHPAHVERVLVDDRESFAKTADFAEAFGSGLLAVEGDTWQRQREFLQPLFYRQAVSGYAETMVDQVDRRVDQWEAGETRSLRDEMKALTLEVLFATLFGRELSMDGDDARLRAAAGGLNAWFVPTSWALPEWVPTPSRRRFERARETLREEVRRLRRDRDDGETGDDLLSLLTDARSSDGYPATDEALEDQLVTMVFAGHETTALTLTYTWYLLARHPEVAARVRNEVDTVVGDGRPGAEQLDDLSVTERVVREAMRLYPPVHTIPRRTTEPVEIDGYRLPSGAEVHVSTFQIHRDERFFDDPLTFRPDRWLDDDDTSRHRFAYVPFGAGPRRCIGRQFALVEATLAVAHIAQEYRLEYVGDGPVELAPEMTTQPDGPVAMRIRARE